MRIGRARIVLVVVLLAGCGFSGAGMLSGVFEGEPDAGANTEAGGADGALTDAAGDALDGPPIQLDAGLDVNPVNCQAACDGGTCDGGWCTLGCSTFGCRNTPVVCPAGIPCVVECAGAASCGAGVNCGAATACAVRCTGAFSCRNAPVQCSGSSCSVECSGGNACNSGVACDAGACAIDCKGSSSCTNSPVDCRSTKCTVACGDGLNNGQNSCTGGVKCVATQSCDIACKDDDTCTNQPIAAVAGGGANVQCLRDNTCNGGVWTSAADSGVSCENTSCGPGIACDGGRCLTRCDVSGDVDVCCTAASCTKSRGNACDLKSRCN